MPFYTDQLQRTINVSSTPNNIISTVPSQTELLHYLGLENEVTGLTKFCIHPKQWHQTKTRIGGTKTLNIATITALQPQLIIANKEENTKAQIDELAALFPVWISDVNNVTDALQMIEMIGSMTSKESAAKELTAQIALQLNTLSEHTKAFINNQTKRLKTAYLIWKDPYMTVGGDTFINSIMELAGFTNVFKHIARYPVITIQDLIDIDCNLLILSSEPYPFKQKHIAELQAGLPHTKIIIADGEAFSWYGSRLLQSVPYLQQLQQQVQAMP